MTILKHADSRPRIRKLLALVLLLWGPLFGKNANDIVIADTEGSLKSTDGGRTWKRLAPLPPFKGELIPKLPGQFTSIAWDPQADILYASRMGAAAYRLPLPAFEK